ncbi:glutathione S-transferase family protein [Pseudooceanicola sp. C21-150M6]|uniref:glutathione S-transferase family protein n=1 Tax=Pseudooceanicola sp. C21-150M6 TaxID=3434355 RepID=UPI003D7FE91F
MPLHLMSHVLCPYVQRAVISLTEKNVAFERTYIDLSAKPDWFLKLSPLGKTPVLVVDAQPVFESAVILEYLEETQPTPLHPRDPLMRAQHRSWIEFGSSLLNDIAGLYNAADRAAFENKSAVIQKKFQRLEEVVGEGPYFSGEGFCLVDAAYGPVFRYFDTFDLMTDTPILMGLPRVAAWRAALAKRPSVRMAVSPDYPRFLEDFIARRGSYLSRIQAGIAGP